MLLLERNDEELKEGKRIKILTRNKLLIRLPTLLEEIKAENNLHKLKKTKSGKYCVFFISTTKSLKTFITI